MLTFTADRITVKTFETKNDFKVVMEVGEYQAEEMAKLMLNPKDVNYVVIIKREGE